MKSPTRHIGKPDPNPGYQRSPTTVHKDRNGRDVIQRDGMIMVDLRDEYRRAGLSWPGEGNRK